MARPVFVSSVATREDVVEQVQLLWGFDNVTILGIGDAYRGPEDGSFCEYVMQKDMTFEYFEDPQNRFTLIGTASDGSGRKEVSYSIFNDMAYGGPFLVRETEKSEFLEPPSLFFEPRREKRLPGDRPDPGTRMNAWAAVKKDHDLVEAAKREVDAMRADLMAQSRATSELTEAIRSLAYDDASVEFDLARSNFPLQSVQQLKDRITRSRTRVMDRVNQVIDAQRKQARRLAQYRFEVEALEDELADAELGAERAQTELRDERARNIFYSQKQNEGQKRRRRLDGLTSDLQDELIHDLEATLSAVTAELVGVKLRLAEYESSLPK
jgi:hypothetical protein